MVGSSALIKGFFLCVAALVSTFGFIGYEWQTGQQLINQIDPHGDYQLRILPEDKFNAFATHPNVINISRGAFHCKCEDELKFILAHEMSHIKYRHMEKGAIWYHQTLTGPPAGISGLIFEPWQRKLNEQQADFMGQDLYYRAGFDMTWFEKQWKAELKKPNKYVDLSINDDHYTFDWRFEKLTKRAKALGYVE